MKLKYTWKWHTVVKINLEKIKVLENEVIDVKEDQKKYFLNNWFEEILSTKLLEEKISEIKSESKEHREKITLEIKKIEDRLFKEIKDIEWGFNYEESKRTVRIKELQEQINNIKEKSVDLDENPFDKPIKRMKKTELIENLEKKWKVSWVDFQPEDNVKFLSELLEQTVNEK